MKMMIMPAMITIMMIMWRVPKDKLSDEDDDDEDDEDDEDYDNDDDDDDVDLHV